MTQGPERSRLRIAFLGMIALSLFSALVLRLWFLQILAHDTYERAAASNQVRVVPIEPTRGRILDRNGEVLVKNRQSYVVAVRPDQLIDREKTVADLAVVLETSVEEIEKRLADKRHLPFAPIPVAEDVSKETATYLREHGTEFRGVYAELRSFRVYPHAGLAAHALGYTGEITEDQLNEERYPPSAGYRQGSLVGRSGVEYAYERELRGTEGLLKLEVDASGKVKKVLDDSGREPKEGSDLVTSLDLRIQAATEEALRLGIEKARTIFDRESQKRYLAPAGGAVVMDVNSGEIIAMASFPSYDPSAFIGGISQPEFDALSNDPAKPLIDRVTQSQFPPGSTFKIVTAAAALQDGLATRNGRYACPGSYRYADRVFRNWTTRDSGHISLVQALIDSCDTVFYDFAAKFYQRFRSEPANPERLQDYARAFGFGQKTGIDIPFEKAGRVPDEGWLQEMHARAPQAFPYKIWLPGYTINLSIGQGDLLNTPLQLSRAFAAVANGGTLVQPHLGLKVMEGESVVKTIEANNTEKLPVQPEHIDTIRRGLEGVTTQGTARGAFSGFPFNQVSVAGKTGTAELQTNPPSQPYAWFTAYAPADTPQYVVTVMLEEGGHGGETAAPIARRIIEAIFNLGLSEIQPAARTD
ncbi:MAG: penicillin-binding protein 2 [Actinobacteria bacterium]|nr:penicillin-binding protein 2 [Actinomycetota bacterium]